MTWYLEAFRRYTDFDGRSGVRAYWMFFLFNTIFALIASMLDHALSITLFDSFYGPIYLLYVAITLIPALAIAVRRLHDTGRHGSWILLGFVPVIGTIVLIVFFLQKGSEGNNGYGDTPPNSLHVSPEQEAADRDSIIIFVIVWMLINTLVFSLLPTQNMEFVTTDAYRNMLTFRNIIWALIPFILAFLVNNKTARIVFIALGALYLLYNLYKIMMLVGGM
jgi:uncharacterized membrane protein YhaH (DUF805 family)